jgi:hypothetical protein
VAQICVSNEEVLAVALAIDDTKEKKYQLIFAANDGVTPGVRAYLRSLQGKLSELASAVNPNTARDAIAEQGPGEQDG